MIYWLRIIGRLALRKYIPFVDGWHDGLFIEKRRSKEDIVINGFIMLPFGCILFRVKTGLYGYSSSFDFRHFELVDLI